MTNRRHRNFILSAIGIMVCLTGCSLGPLSFLRKPDTKTPDLADYLTQTKWDTGSSFDFPETTEFRLSNGLQVILVQKLDVPMVYARAQIRGGSIYDPAEQSGLAYLTGWVLTEGTESYPNEEIDAVMDSHGAYVSSVAYNESCIVTLTCLTEDVTTLFPYFAEIIARPAFDEQVIEESKRYLIGDLMRKQDDVGDVCDRVFRDAVFEGHPYQKQMNGTLDGLKAITGKDVRQFWKDHYCPDRAVLVVVGNISKENAVEMCETYLGSWPVSTKPLPIVGVPRPIEGIRVLLVDKPVTQAQIMMGHIGINRTNPDRFDLLVMNKILGGGGLYTRLAEEVRVKRGLTYSIYSYFARRDYTGEFLLSTFTRAESAVETIRVCLQEIAKIRHESVTQEELENAKMTLIASHPLQFEEYEDIAQTLVHNAFYGLPLTEVTHFADQVEKVSISDVQRVAQKYLHPDDMVIVVVGPAETLLPELETIGPVVVVDPI